jgi:amino acid adenylation domain-containing protein/thioester reductase-like protein
MRAPATCLHRLFQLQAGRTPTIPAVVDDDKVYTYEELDKATDALAGYLQNQGIHFDEPVGIFMDTCADYVLPYIAALKAGGAYMPLDLAYPLNLLEKILKEAKPKVIVTKSQYTGRLDFEYDGTILAIDKDQAWRFSVYDIQRIASQTPDHLAFVAYSSGTTGDPKGILNPHRGAFHSYFRRYEISDYSIGDRIACNIFFIWEVLRPLLKGATCYVVPDDIIYDPRRLIEFVHKHRINEILLTPSLLETVLNTCEGNWLRSMLQNLQVLWLNGEVVTTKLRHRALNNIPSATRLLNTYSISECHDVASLDLKKMENPGRDFCSVGYPNKDVDIKLIDEFCQPADDRPGELLIGGPCLARGYLNKPEQTAERFLDIDGQRYYRTGDLARLSSDGQIEILGRCDFMAKIRGYSIHLGAVETAIMTHACSKFCAVVADGKEGEAKRLVAYIVRDDNATWTINPESGASPELRRILESHIPPYMIPSVYVELYTIPLNPATGKLDHKKLPSPPQRHTHTCALSRLPENVSRKARKKAMLQLWERVLTLEPGNLKDDSNFFDYGGNSLLTVELSLAVEQVFGIDLMAKTIYANPTVRDLLSYMEKRTSEETNASILKTDSALDPRIVPKSRSTVLSLSDAKVALLTGATGFLGAFLLRQIIDSTPDSLTVYCLVRAGNDISAGDRIKSNLLNYGLWDQRLEDRIFPFHGNLAGENLNLSQNFYHHLAREADFIFHCASLVNFLHSYELIRPHTVDGTREMLKMACTSHNKPFYHISTNGIFPPDPSTVFPEDNDIDRFSENLSNGYCQAKWVAEKLVWEVMSRGLPAAIFRPGNIGHHSITGHANPNDFQVMIIDACIRCTCAPQVYGWYFEMTPVDFLARSIIEMSKNPVHFGRAFNIVAANLFPAEDIFKLMQAKGIVTEIVPLQEWKRIVSASAASENFPGLKLVAQLIVDIEPFLTDVGVYDCQGYESALSACGIERPSLDTEYFERLLSRTPEPYVVPQSSQL